MSATAKMQTNVMSRTLGRTMPRQTIQRRILSAFMGCTIGFQSEEAIHWVIAVIPPAASSSDLETTRF